jgi:hypothetical protein
LEKSKKGGFKCLPKIVKGYLVSRQYTSLSAGSPCPYLPLITYIPYFVFGDIDKEQTQLERMKQHPIMDYYGGP